MLRSKESAVLRIPNSALAGAMYVMLALLVQEDHAGAATLAAILAVAASVYLGYVMVVRLAALCSHCVNLAALNLLILWQLLR